MPDFDVTVHAEVPDKVAAQAAFDGDPRTVGFGVGRGLGSERRIVIRIERANDEADAKTLALADVQDVLGDLITGKSWAGDAELVS